uniref:Glycerol-1-phosphate dehydrogenase [NAD(P)+] n=2 Tax=Methanobacteriati TaxID=3366610 RepID=A0A075GXD9_9EURY|nr:NAD(P)-dependent glycerol-1-phosphate dehydrogenase [uncultured marine group II/III euryarchaeote KM3_205_C10]
MKPRPPRSMVLPRMVVTGPGVIEQLPDVIAELDLPERGLLVCDAVTRSVAGDRVLGYLEETGHPVAVIEIDGASMEELARVEAAAEGCGFLAGVGGGRPVDLAKQAGYHLDLPFISVPTAASHDGFASARASIRAEGQKTSMEARPPIAVVADTSIIASAPHRLLAAGIGDIVSNQTAVLDWQLGRDRGEEYSAYAAALSEMTARLVEEDPELVGSGSEEGVRLVVKALISSGVAMSIAGSSRPASGGEHKFSHWLDANAGSPALHGEQCGVGSVVTMQLHGGDWQRIRDTLAAAGAPVTAEQLGLEDAIVLEALREAHTIRPQRYTILDREPPETIERAARETGVVS